jgi:LEA14-like dessication related protein
LSTANIYPNPAQNSAIVELKLQTSSEVEIKLINVVGQQLKIVTAQGQVGENRLPLDLSGLSQGIYLVDIKAGNAWALKKLVVE